MGQRRVKGWVLRAGTGVGCTRPHGAGLQHTLAHQLVPSHSPFWKAAWGPLNRNPQLLHQRAVNLDLWKQDSKVPVKNKSIRKPKLSIYRSLYSPANLKALLDIITAFILALKQHRKCPQTGSAFNTTV